MENKDSDNRIMMSLILRHMRNHISDPRTGGFYRLIIGR